MLMSDHFQMIFAVEEKGEPMTDWNLGDGLPNVANSIRRKLSYAGHQLEERERTILNVDSYEVTVLVWALSEYMERKGIEHEDRSETLMRQIRSERGIIFNHTIERMEKKRWKRRELLR